MKRKIYFANLHPSLVFMPTVWGYLRSFAEQDAELASAYTFEKPFYFFPDPNRDLDGAADGIEAPAVLAVSCYVWNFELNMELCRQVKARFPSCLIVAGGPHIPHQPKESLLGDFFVRYPFVDLLVHLEGETAFAAILREALSPKPDWTRIPRVSFQQDGATVTTSAAGRIQLLRKNITELELPSPFLKGYFDELIVEAKRDFGHVRGLWETNRGCPYRCTFCEWGDAALGKFKSFSTERLLAEVAYFSQREVDLVYGADANFGILERDLELASALAARKRATGYPRQFHVNYAKNSNDRIFSIAKMLADEGMIKGASLAVQSNNEESLRAIKRNNIGLANYRALKERYAEARVPTYTDLIIALPLETRDSWISGNCDLLAAGNHDDIQAFDLCLMPNTPMVADKEKYGLKTVKRRFDSNLKHSGVVDLVIETSTMSVDARNDCRVFSDFCLGTLHHGGYTQFLARFLHQTGQLSYRDFYEGLLTTSDLPLVETIRSRLYRLARDFVDPRIDLSINNLVYSQPDMRATVEPYASKAKRRFTVTCWSWLALSEHGDQLSDELERFVQRVKGGDRILADLLRYQRDVMLRLDYDPEQGKVGRYAYHWPRYFHADGALIEQPVDVRFTDRAMGLDAREVLRAGNKPAFAAAAIGSYWPDGRWRRYVHQHDRMQINTGAPISIVLPPQTGKSAQGAAARDRDARDASL